MKLFAVVSLALSLTVSAALAQSTPTCTGSSGMAMSVNDAQVLNWKESTPNQFRSRAFIDGTLKTVFPDRTGHNHLEVQIGPNPDDTVEIIYNEDFGQTNDNFHPGQHVQACGDYITATSQAGPYPPSPDGAIIHWVHQSPSPNHPNGFLMIDGVLYGQDAEDAPPKPPRSYYRNP